MKTKRQLRILDFASLVYLFVILCVLRDHFGDREGLFARLFGSEITDTNPAGWRAGILTVECALVLLLLYLGSRWIAPLSATGLLTLLLGYTVYVYRFTNGATLTDGILSKDRWYQHTWLRRQV